jgi:ABC-type enterochelin transport system substrate-binding protein
VWCAGFSKINHGAPAADSFEQLERNDENFWLSLSAQKFSGATGQTLHNVHADVFGKHKQRVKRKTKLDAALCDLTQTISTASGQNRCAVRTFTWNITHENLHYHCCIQS